jgi:hypothetical protein
MKPLTQRFVIGKEEYAKFSYVGFRLEQNSEKVFIDQRNYVNDIEIPNVSSIAKQGISPLSPSEQTVFRSLVGSLNWLVQVTRPDLAFPLLELSSKMPSSNFDDLKQVVKVLTRLRDDPRVIVVPKIGFDVTSWRIVLYSDAVYANLPDRVSSTYGVLVFLVGSSGCALISWRAGKIIVLLDPHSQQRLSL